MLSLPAQIDSVEAAKAILLVAREQLGAAATNYQRELMDALLRYVKEEGSVPTMRRALGMPKARNHWRLREARRRSNNKNCD